MGMIQWMHPLHSSIIWTLYSKDQDGQTSRCINPSCRRLAPVKKDGLWYKKPTHATSFCCSPGYNGETSTIWSMRSSRSLYIKYIKSVRFWFLIPDHYCKSSYYSPPSRVASAICPPLCGPISIQLVMSNFAYRQKNPHGSSWSADMMATTPTQQKPPQSMSVSRSYCHDPCKSSLVTTTYYCVVIFFCENTSNPHAPHPATILSDEVTRAY